MAQAVEYPVHMYKHLHRARYAHDRKAVEALTLDGWTDIRANIEKQDYPCVLYRDDGHTVTIGDYDREGIVDLAKAQAEEARLTDEGWSRKAVARAAVEEATPVSLNEAVAAAPKHAIRIDAVEQGLAVLGSDVEALKADTAELKTGIAAILAELQTSNKKTSNKKNGSDEG